MNDTGHRSPAPATARPIDPPVPPGKHIVDVLIEERARWLAHTGPLWFLIRTILFPLLKYREAIELADRIGPMGGEDIMEMVSQDLQLDVRVEGLEHVPASGGVIIAPNHPTGIVDGIAVWDALRRVRNDISFFANRDAIRVSPGLRDCLIPVEWVPEKRTVAKTRDMIKRAQASFAAGEAVVLFPSGRIARRTPSGLAEQAWLPAVVTFARKYGTPVVPLGLTARNSWVYYFFDRFSPELRDMTLFYEMLNKKEQTFAMRFGPAVPVGELEGEPSEAAERLRQLSIGLAPQL
ncbi:MAG: 1-acyl-sn-glycerol-3-phosphate acyltransferase [Alphaproteobacteria bacterium]